MKTFCRMLLAGALCAGSSALAEEPWLPPQVEEGAARQLAERLRATGDGVQDEAKLLQGARDLIHAMRGTIDAWGAAGVISRAPRFPSLRVPESSRASLDAMGRWNVCIMTLYLAFEDPALAADGNARLLTALGLSAVTLAILRLREPLVADGGSDADMEAHLTGPGSGVVLTAMQTDPEIRAGAETQCQPVLRELLAAPIAYLQSPAGS